MSDREFLKKMLSGYFTASILTRTYLTEIELSLCIATTLWRKMLWFSKTHCFPCIEIEGHI